MADWEPPSARKVEDDNWEPPSARVPVKEHSRKPRARIGAAAGGMIGGLAGKVGGYPGAVAGAGIGGAAGEALQQGLESGPPMLNPVGTALAGLAMGGANPQGIAQQGAIQAGLEATGGLAMKGLEKAGSLVAKPLMSKALGVAKPLVRNFPTVVEDALRQGASVNRWFGKGGAQAAEQVRKDATGKVVGLLRAATRRGAAIDIEQVAAPAIQAIEKKSGPMTAVERSDFIQKVQDRADELLLKSVMGATQRSAKLMSPMMADELRQAAARQATAAFRAEGMGIPQTAIPDLDRLIAKGAAGAVRSLKGVAAARNAEQAAIGVSRAVREAELKPAGSMVGLGVGPIKAGLGLPPGAASRLALIANSLGNPLVGPIVANLLRSGTLVAQ